MAPKKKSIGRTPICDPNYLRRIDPVWVPGPVPQGYWQDVVHRRDYLLWLSGKLHFRWMEDFYKLTYRDIARNGGAGLARNYWRASAVEGVLECFSEYDWREWLFATTPKDFWDAKENRRRYMRWLGQQLGFRRPEDWYRVTTQDFLANKGSRFLHRYKKALSSAVKDYLPDYDWKEWLFGVPPPGFWAVRKNRRRYLRWLGERLGYRRPEDWYTVQCEDFAANHGYGCLRYYHQSPALAAMDLFPRHTWHEWKFQRVPCGFWNQAENRKRYVRWLGEQLGYHRPEDWHRVRQVDFAKHYGDSLLVTVGSYIELLEECLPEIDWVSQRRAIAPPAGSAITPA